MKTINLRDVFPDCNRDCFIEVPASQYETYLASLTREIAEVYIEFEREDEAWSRQRSRYGAYYSLDYGDGIEKHILTPIPTPEQIHELEHDNQQLYNALSELPLKQARRIYAHYFLGQSKAEIARKEGVDERSIRTGIKRGLNKLSKRIS